LNKVAYNKTTVFNKSQQTTGNEESSITLIISLSKDKH